MSTPAITLRPIAPTDQEFLFQVYASTRAAELAPLGWNAAQLRLFLEQQFHAQRRHYETYFGSAAFLIIQADGVDAGRLYVARQADEIRVIDIALLPAYCKRGIGSQLLCALCAEGAAKQLPVRLHVEQTNPAQHLYQRLGFTRIADEGIYRLMEWKPGSEEQGVENATPDNG